jgi:hypothetical protein
LMALPAETPVSKKYKRRMEPLCGFEPQTYSLPCPAMAGYQLSYDLLLSNILSISFFN